MGNSPTASFILGFAIEPNLDTEEMYPWGDSFYDFDEWVDQKLGREKPAQPDHQDYSHKDWKKWRNDSGRFEGDRPFRLAYDGSADSEATWYFCSVCISGSWDFATIVEDDTLELTRPDETKKLRDEMFAFCKTHDISWQEPRWQLLAAYG
jgi:hypothetical protein